MGQANLPAQGLLDAIDLKPAAFTTVGYGLVRTDKTKGSNSLSDDGGRRFAAQTATQLVPAG